MAVVRVLVADDEDIIREALSDVLGADGRFEVVGIATSGDELAEMAVRLRPDVVLLDVRMPGGGVPAAQAVLAHRLPGPDDQRSAAPVVVACSAHTGAAVVASMLRAGATGYLAKGRLAALPDLLARCAAGEVVLAVPSGAEALRQAISQTTGQPSRS